LFAGPGQGLFDSVPGHLFTMLGDADPAVNGAGCSRRACGPCPTPCGWIAGTGIHVALVEPGPITSRFRASAFAALGGEKLLPFTLPPEVVLEKVMHALEARRPKRPADGSGIHRWQPE
jgi:hypothetical protein